MKPIPTADELVASWGEDEDGNKADCDTAQRARDFAVQMQIWDAPVEPLLWPACDGVDIHYESPRVELLINVPDDPASPMSYYGDNLKREHESGYSTVKGLLSPNTNQAWLAKWVRTMQEAPQSNQDAGETPIIATASPVPEGMFRRLGGVLGRVCNVGIRKGSTNERSANQSRMEGAE